VRKGRGLNQLSSTQVIYYAVDHAASLDPFSRHASPDPYVDNSFALPSPPSLPFEPEVRYNHQDHQVLHDSTFHLSSPTIGTTDRRMAKSNATRAAQSIMIATS